ncbi:MAG: hypothetical protein A2Y81_10620 [Nitrospirae bacterium RBG_13_43_8]|nr:MAG: hypothetical protein A2Y81_10620 [Nitrospirae bacterium RBG_13_43_8]
MDNGSLIDYVIKDRRHCFANILESWIISSKKFKEFVLLYRDKIRKKISGATTDEILNDVLSELEVAYFLLLDDRFEVKYEEGRYTKSRSPDFIVTFEQTIPFILEVKRFRRIREKDLGCRYDKAIQDIADIVQKLPSSLAFSLYADDVDAAPELLNKFEASREAVAKYIINTVRESESRLDLNSDSEHAVPGFNGDLVLILTRPSGKITNDETSYHVGSRPLFYSQKEYRQFSDEILGKLGQMRPDMINILMISSDSDIHEPEALFQAIYSIAKLSNKKDDDFFIRKGFKGTADFLGQWRKLSGVVFRSIWVKIDDLQNRNLVWLNTYAQKKVPSPIIEYLQKMNRPEIFC